LFSKWCKNTEIPHVSLE
jgi:hypothetical protein